MSLVDHRGRPITSADFKKANPPVMGERFAPWAGRTTDFTTLPGGALINFDLNQLTLADYRLMRDHYQINASLSILTFMLHQIDFTVDCKDAKIARHCEDNLRQVWSQLVRSMSHAFWAGFSPNVLQYENDVQGGTIQVTKIKDLIPEESRVHWKDVKQPSGPGQVEPKILIYDGIQAYRVRDHIPVQNTFWYPLLMQFGDYYGTKLLRSAFVPWFFSNLMHLFSNRYFERFGEPLPVGRAPDGGRVVTADGTEMEGNAFMLQVLQMIRNRSVVVLPSDRTQVGMAGQAEYEYTLEYLESQMRGADFERYLTRLDEEISLALFTPLLMLRTADVGSYNLGVTHKEVYLWMLNAISGDWKFYIDNYLLNRMVDFNFSVNAPRATINFRKLGQAQMQILQSILSELTKQGGVKYDMVELGQAVGLGLEEVKIVTAPADAPAGDGGGTATDTRVRTRTRKGNGPRGVGEPRATAKDIAARVGPQVNKAFRDGTFGPGFAPSLGHRNRFESSLRVEGASNDEAERLTSEFYRRMDNWVKDVCSLGTEEFSGAEAFMSLFRRVLDSEVDRLSDDAPE